MKALLSLVVLLVASCHVYPAPKWPAPWESEILHVCWTDDGLYAPAAVDCDNPQPIQWPALPLVVSGDQFTGHNVVAAIEVWNEWLGFVAFKYSPFELEADVRVRYAGQPPASHPTMGGIVMFGRTGDEAKQYALVAIFNPGLMSPEAYVHELGHVLGLAHDEDNVRSIMYPNASGVFIAQLETKDRALLRRRYFYPHP